MALAINPAVSSGEPGAVAAKMRPPSRFGDKAFEALALTMALVVVLLVFLVGWQLARGSSLAIEKFGFHFLAGVADEFRMPSKIRATAEPPKGTTPVAIS